MSQPINENWKADLNHLVRDKISRIFSKRKKMSVWKEFIKKNISGQKISLSGLEKTVKESYPGEFEEFLNSGEMQLSILFARLRALEKTVMQASPRLKENFDALQASLAEELIAREWLAYKSGKLSASDFYDFLENKE